MVSICPSLRDSLHFSASRMEGLPFNLLESLYCHVPVIASDIKGHRDLIRNGENGLLFSCALKKGFAYVFNFNHDVSPFVYAVFS